MLGAIVGDVIGSIYEGYQWNNIQHNIWIPHTNIKAVLKRPLYRRHMVVTDDTVLSLASYYSYRHNKDIQYALRNASFNHFHVGFGGKYKKWVQNPTSVSPNSFGNGALMRLSWMPVLIQHIEDARPYAIKNTITTHDHRDSLLATEYWLRYAYDIKTNPDHRHTWYNDAIFNPVSIEELHNEQLFAIKALDLMRQVVHVMHYAHSFDHAIQLACYIGGDTDTLASVVGSAAEIVFGVPTGYREHITPLLKKQLWDWLFQEFIASQQKTA